MERNFYESTTVRCENIKNMVCKNSFDRNGNDHDDERQNVQKKLKISHKNILTFGFKKRSKNTSKNYFYI